MRSIEDLAIDITELANGLEPSDETARIEMERIQAAYREVFGSTKGPIVLRDMLRDLSFLGIPRSDNQVVLQAYATILLRKCGVLDRDGASQGAIDSLIATARLS